MQTLLRWLAGWLGRGDRATGEELLAEVSDLYRERRSRSRLRAVTRGVWDLASLLCRPRLPRRVRSHTWIPNPREGWRHWRRRPGLAAAAVLTLGVGLAASVTTYSVVNGVLLRPLTYPEWDRLVIVWNTYESWQRNPLLAPRWNIVPLSWPEYVDARDQARTIDGIALYSPRRAVITETDAAYELQGAVVTASFFPLLGGRTVLGRTFTAAEDAAADDVVVISHEVWQGRLGGRRDVIGQTLLLGSRAVTIVGVVGPGFDYRGEAFWQPVGIDAGENRDRDTHSYEAIARLAPGVAPDMAVTELAPILLGPRPVGAQGLRLERLIDNRIGAARQPLLVILTAAVLLLLIACANVSGLLVGDLASRRTEMTVRAALGATRVQLAREVLGSGVVLGMAAVGLGIAGAVAAMPVVLRLLPTGTPRSDGLEVDAAVLVMAAAAGLVTTLLFSLGPLALLARGRVQAGLRHDTRGPASGWKLQAGLAVGEVALAVMLLVGAGLLVRTFVELTRVDPGFRSASLVTARLSPPSWRYDSAESVNAFYETVAARLRALPGVTGVAAVSRLAFADAGLSTSVGFRTLDRDAQRPEVRFQIVSPGYAETMGIPLAAGRDLAATDTRGKPYVALVSETFARQFFGREAIGREFEWDDRWFSVVGVVGDVRHDAVTSDRQPTFYLSFDQVGVRNRRLAIRTVGDETALSTGLAGLLRSIDPQVLVSDVSTIGALIDRSLEGDRFRMALITTFAGLSLVLCGVGLYAAVARTVSERRREIGVRLALGARSTDVVQLLLRQSAGVVVAGGLVGALGSAVAVRGVRTFLFGVTPADPIVIGGVVVLLVALVACTTAVPARRAAAIDPATTFRESVR